MKTYDVTVTPRKASFAGSWSDRAYTVQVIANDRAEAIKKARQQRRGEEGRHAVACDYSARVALTSPT